ncbi:MAG: hypothetical protein N2111_08870 [Candidatus Sumerlaeaceae bacterium]|nr:hypothetical protein [Candidatus Sumerlaeaceae bacterium]
MTERVRYVFRKPAWRVGVPLALLLVVWTVPWLLSVLPTFPVPPKIEPYYRLIWPWLETHQVTVRHAVWAAWVLSVPLLVWLITGFERLVITPESIYRWYPFHKSRPLRWADADEILIDHVQHRFEGRHGTTRTIYIYEVRRLLEPWRRCMRITDSQFEGYHHVERLAVYSGIPAIAARRLREVSTRRRPALFPVRSPGDGVKSFVFSLAGLAAFLAAGHEALWVSELSAYRPWVVAGGVLLVLWAARLFFYRQLGIDTHNLYIMRRQWVVRTVPIRSILESKTRGAAMEIIAAVGRGEKPRTVFRTKRFVRNRAVILTMIREARRALDALDSQAIPRIQASADSPLPSTAASHPDPAQPGTPV